MDYKHCVDVHAPPQWQHASDPDFAGTRCGPLWGEWGARSGIQFTSWSEQGSTWSRLAGVGMRGAPAHC
jgi:hypothetical protein